jgi:hypothetical protein
VVWTGLDLKPSERVVNGVDQDLARSPSDVLLQEQVDRAERHQVSGAEADALLANPPVVDLMDHLGLDRPPLAVRLIRADAVVILDRHHVEPTEGDLLDRLESGCAL